MKYLLVLLLLLIPANAHSAFELVGKKDGFKVYMGLSSDSKPTDVNKGDIAYETDTSLSFTRSETEWKRGLIGATKTPYLYQIAEGGIADHDSIFKFGENPDVGTSSETIWYEGGIYPWAAVDAAEGIVKISSSDADDTHTTGTGARTCTIYGLSTAGVDQNETVSLTGLTAVNSTLEYSRVNRIIVNTTGTSLSNEGIIYVGTGTVTDGKPAVVWALVGATLNQTLMSVWTVPTGKTLYILSFEAALDTAKGADISVFVRPPGEVFQIKYRTHVYAGAFFRKFEVPLVIEAGTDIDVRATGTATGAQISSTFQGWYED